jgi:hypothetical protein
MIHALKPIVPSAAEIMRWPALKNPVVARCHLVWQRVHRTVYKEKQSPVLARIAAANAFREALPALDTFQNIRDFITCVGFGLTSGVIFEASAADLFHAAEVALRADARTAKTKKAVPSTTKNTKNASKPILLETNDINTEKFEVY